MDGEVIGEFDSAIRIAVKLKDKYPITYRKISMRFLYIFILTLFASSALANGCKSTEVVDLSPFASVIGERKVVFVAQDVTSGRCWVSNKDQANERYSPWSTFKIPHFFIALETGALQSVDETIRWSPTRRPAEAYWPDTWARDQTLNSAFKHSAAWFFQELVATVGVSNYQLWLDRFDYGNRVVPKGRDDFWLRSPLLISPMEQVAFLFCVAATGCGVAPQYVKMFEAVALSDDIAGSRLYAKTGAGPVKEGEFDGAFQGWYVGYSRTPAGKPGIAFALHVQSQGFASLRTFRREMALQLLTHIGAWPTPQ